MKSLVYKLGPAETPEAVEARLIRLLESLDAGEIFSTGVIKSRLGFGLAALKSRREFIERVNKEAPILEQKIALLQDLTALQSYQLTTLMHEHRRRIARALAIRGQRTDTTNKE